MPQGFNKIHHKVHPITKSHGTFAHMLDKSMLAIGLIAPIMTVPQLVDVVVHHSVHGVSITTWGAYAIVSSLWALYGVIHKDKPILITNILLFLFDTTIVLGVLLQK